MFLQLISFWFFVFVKFYSHMIFFHNYLCTFTIMYEILQVLLLSLFQYAWQQKMPRSENHGIISRLIIPSFAPAQDDRTVLSERHFLSSSEPAPQSCAALFPDHELDEPAPYLHAVNNFLIAFLYHSSWPVKMFPIILFRIQVQIPLRYIESFVYCISFPTSIKTSAHSPRYRFSRS